MIKDKLVRILEERMRISEETQDNWDYGIEQCWEKEIELLSHNVNDTIMFFKNDCTAEEFSWLSEVFEQVAKKTQSQAFVDCLYNTAKKYPNICKKYHIDFVIQCADGAIEK